jgi:hypothetical protein
MRQRYPDTLRVVGLILGFAVVVVLDKFWRPGLWIVVGVCVAALLALTIRSDRKRRPRTDDPTHPEGSTTTSDDGGHW